MCFSDEMKQYAPMECVGTVHSEEMMAGSLPDGRRVYVEMLSAYLKAPEGQRDDPVYWQARIEQGDFDDPENYPMAWIEK